MALGHLLYISDAIETITDENLEAIRKVSTEHNAEHGITGILFYSAGHFVQLLEGDPGKIRRLFDKIVLDRRHTAVKLLIERPAEERIFPDWSMGVLDLRNYSDKERLDLDDLVHLSGYQVHKDDGTPIELEILSRFCMLLPAG